MRAARRLRIRSASLAIEINQLADAMQSQRLSGLEAVALLRRVILEMDSPVLAFDELSALRVVNPSAERVLHLIAARDLGRTADELGLRKILDEPDEGITTIEDQGQQARWMVRRSSFRQRGVPHTLLVLSDVSTHCAKRSGWHGAGSFVYSVMN